MTNTIGALLILSLVVLIHEFGHFIVAKMCGVGVFEFAIGFGKRLFSFEKDGTIYSFRAIPLGGFVSMVGESAHGEPDPNLTESQKKLLDNKSSYFNAQAVWKRALIVVAGPVFNILSTVIFSFCSLYFFGFPLPSSHPKIGEVSEELPAAKAGFKRGDIILTINNTPVAQWGEVIREVRKSNGEEIVFKVKRESDGNSDILTLKVVPSQKETEIDKFLASGSDTEKKEDKPKSFRVGLNPTYEKLPISFQTALYFAPSAAISITELTIKSLTMLFSGELSPTNLSGPIGVIKGASDSVDRGFDGMIDFAILLSISLAIFNLLPIPILDGGHLMLMLIETLIRRPLREGEFLVANRIGLVFVLSLMVFAFGNDLAKIFFPA